MTRTTSMLAALVLAIASLSFDFAWADEGANAGKSPPVSTVEVALKPTPDAVSRNEIALGGQHIAYTATAGGILAAANNGQRNSLPPQAPGRALSTCERYKLNESVLTARDFIVRIAGERYHWRIANLDIPALMQIVPDLPMSYLEGATL